MAVEVLYLGYLLWEPAPALDWYLVVPVLVAVASIVASLLVLFGKARGWMFLAGTAVLPLVALLVLVFILASLGATAEAWSAVLMTTGPLGCLILATRRPVREWTAPRRTTRSPGGRRTPGRRALASAPVAPRAERSEGRRRRRGGRSRRSRRHRRAG